MEDSEGRPEPPGAGPQDRVPAERPASPKDAAALCERLETWAENVERNAAEVAAQYSGATATVRDLNDHAADLRAAAAIVRGSAEP